MMEGSATDCPNMAQLITDNGLSPGEAEVLRCILKPKDKLQSYWRARTALEELIKQEEKVYNIGEG